MKRFVMISLGAAALAFSGCQNGSHASRNQFDQKTHRTYNPETGSWEQSPPFGKQSNKSGDE